MLGRLSKCTNTLELSSGCTCEVLTAVLVTRFHRRKTRVWVELCDCVRSAGGRRPTAGSAGAGRHLRACSGLDVLSAVCHVCVPGTEPGSSPPSLWVEAGLSTECGEPHLGRASLPPRTAPCGNLTDRRPCLPGVGTVSGSLPPLKGEHRDRLSGQAGSGESFLLML